MMADIDSCIICISGERRSNYFRNRIEEEINKYKNKYNNKMKCIFGDCDGVDSDAKDICIKLDIEYTIFPADWKKYGLIAGPKRNKAMIDLLHTDRDILLAFHRNIAESKGTLNTINIAKKKGIKFILYSM